MGMKCNPITRPKCNCKINDNNEGGKVQEVTEYGTIEKSTFINIYSWRLNCYLNKIKKKKAIIKYIRTCFKEKDLDV